MDPTSITPDHVSSNLNNLIELNRDSQHGFQESAAKIDLPQIKSLFLEQSLLRAKFVGELQAQVRSLGVEPENTGSIAAALHRGWLELKAALGGGDAAILSATETGEEHAINAYVNALTKPLPAPARAMLEGQLQSIRHACTTVKQLRSSREQ